MNEEIGVSLPPDSYKPLPDLDEWRQRGEDLHRRRLEEVMDALARLKADQLELDFCPTCGQEMPKLRCVGCGDEISREDIAVHNDNGRFCSKTECFRIAMKTLL